jgi:2-keto-4-pentenoate hydratase/2-oxohepta-3-ene-1,7-dioic acid hydratase in catechol pathway
VLPIPEHPILFFKANSAIVGPNDDMVMPRGSTQATDWEVELGVVIGKAAKYVSEAIRCAGSCGRLLRSVNDVSSGISSCKLSGQWTKGKSCDTFGPHRPLAGDARRGRPTRRTWP